MVERGTRVRKLLAFLFILLVTLTPHFAEAHVKWFTKSMREKAPIEEIITPLFMGTAVICVMLLVCLTIFVMKATNWSFFSKRERWLSGFRKHTLVLLRYGTVLALVIQVMSSVVFSPGYQINHTIITYSIWITIALLLIPDYKATKGAGLILLGLFTYLTAQNGLFDMLDESYFLSIIAVFLICETKWEKFSIPLLYLGTGLSLCWVAIEKWVFPGMSIDIIANYHVPTFGFPPEIFIVLVAFVEFVIGYLFIIGLLNRILGFVVTVIFILTTTLFGWTEIVGHTMLHILFLIFIIEDTSFYWTPLKIYKTQRERLLFVSINFILLLVTLLLVYYIFACMMEY